MFGLGPVEPVQPPNDGRLEIKPLVGLGSLTLGDTPDKIELALGKPDFKIGDDIYQYAGFVVTVRDEKVYSIQCGDATASDTRFVRDCFCKTPEGLGMGASEQDIKAVFGEPDRRIENQPIEGSFVILYRSKGLAFGLHDNKVHYISIQLPRE